MRKSHIIFVCIVTYALFLFFSPTTECKQYYEQIDIENHLQSIRTGRGQGFRAEMQGDYKSAIEYFSKAIELNPKDSISYHQRGLCYYYLDDYNNALKDFDKAISLNPNETDAYGNRSLVKMQFEDYEGAIKDIEEVLKVAPDYPKAIKQKEMILNKMQQK